MSIFKSSATDFILLSLSGLMLCFSSEAAPVLIDHDCPDGNLFQPNSSFEDNLNVLLSSLTSKASSASFNHTTQAPGTRDAVSGLFFCRGTAKRPVCKECVAAAAKEIRRLCPNQKESIISYDMCLLRYSNQSFNDINPLVSASDNNSIDSAEKGLLDKVLLNTLSNLVAIANSPTTNRFATQELNLTSSQTLHCSVQCKPVLSTFECDLCLKDAIVFLPTCCRGDRNASVVLPRCNVGYELRAYNTTATPPEPVVPPPSGKKKGQLKKIIGVVVPIVASGIVFCLVCCFLRVKKRKNYKAVLRENFGIESTAVESLQFSLATIEAATNKFSQMNRIGKGGFGEVYKGILFDGRQIAIKKLSRSSEQGAIEFKNEVLLIAKLQHRNLVTLLGFCLEEQEKILIYEYVPNNSLDYFLFGTQKRSALNWPTRYKIIEGIAQGILYLHKYSRLKIIHRDLKPSNILLDNNMNPKISDFGMAKMVGLDENQGSTKRVVGTFGYMSPEYIMLGQFSEKSDIFSFGVMVLEIISGKKNASCYEAQYVNGLLNYAWKQWRDENLLEILDSRMTEVGSQSEVIKCIHIGLLCVQENPDARPPMSTIVSYLNNDSIELPFPKEPAFFMHGRMKPQIVGAKESGSSQHINNSTLSSVNEMSMSNFFPR